MSKYKLVPVEPTDEMGIAGCEAVTEMPNNTWLDHYEAVTCFKAMLAAAPDVQGEPVAYLRIDQLRQAQCMGPMLGEIAASPRVDRVPVYTAPQPATEAAPKPAGCTLNSEREQVTEVEAPSNSLPSWSECNLRVGNSEWLKDNGREPECDSLTANPLHEFIYEYDDSDAYKSAWFLHRLENLIDFIRSEQHLTPDTALVEAFDAGRRAAQVEAAELVDALKALIEQAQRVSVCGSFLSDAVVQAIDALAAYRLQVG